MVGGGGVKCDGIDMDFLTFFRSCMDGHFHVGLHKHQIRNRFLPSFIFSQSKSCKEAYCPYFLLLLSFAYLAKMPLLTK